MAGSAVLEVGCGTGQLTEQLVRYDIAMTALDIGSAMVAAAQRRVGRSDVRFEVGSFEDFKAADASFNLVVSASAFHWVDPEVRFVKSARLLRPGGWLVLLSTGERYDDPFGSALLEMWISRSDDGGALVKQQQVSDSEIIDSAGLFDTPIEKAHANRISLPSDVVIGVENTRATSLSWDEHTRQSFVEELHDQLRAQPEISLTQVTSLTMAQALPRL